MPISPKDALGNRPAQLQMELSRLEEKVDMLLRSTFNGRDGIKITMPHNLNLWVKDQLKARYGASGWAVTFDEYSDFRESWSYLVLTPKVDVI